MELGVPVCCIDNGEGGVKEYFCERIAPELPLAVSGNGLDDDKAWGPFLLEILSENEQVEGSHLPFQWFRKPYLFLYLVDHSETDTISKEEKKSIKSWSLEMQGKHEWMVIQFIAPQVKRSVLPFYDKSKLDVQKDRYFQIPKTKEENEEWNEMTKKMGETLIVSFKRQIKEYKIQEKERRNQSEHPAWNFFNYFTISEGLAFTWMQCNQLEDALQQYTTIGALYYALGSRKILPKLYPQSPPQIIEGKIIPNIDHWISVERRELIYQNQVSEFQLFEYMFARQFFLLMALHRPLKAFESALQFLSSAVHSLDDHSDLFSSYLNFKVFKNVWAFSAGCSIFLNKSVQTFLQTAPGQLTAETSKSYSLLGNILSFVRSCMDTLLALASPHFPALGICCSDPPEPIQLDHIPQLVDALEDRALFDACYLAVSKKAVECYQLSEFRPRAINQLYFEIGILHYKQQRYELACEYLKKITIEQGWNIISSQIRIFLAECENHLGHLDMFVKVALGLLGPECEEAVRTEYQERVLAVVPNLPSVIVRNLSPLIESTLRFNREEVYYVGDTLTVTCLLRSNFLHPILFHKLTLTMTDSNPDPTLQISETIRLIERKVMIQPGQNQFSLSVMLRKYPKMSFAFDSIALEVGKLNLSQQLVSYYQPIKVESSQPTLEFDISRSKFPCAGQTQSLQLTLYSNNDAIVKGVLILASTTGLEIQDHKGQMRILSPDETVREELFEIKDQSFAIPVCKKGDIIELFFPVFAPVATDHEISISIAYEKETTETFNIVGLVNIEFFCPFEYSHHVITSVPESIFIAVTGKNMASFPMVIKKHTLTPPEGYTLQDMDVTIGDVIVLPHKKFSFAYPLSVTDNNSKDLASDCKFQLYFSSSEVFDPLVDFLPALFTEKYMFSIPAPVIHFDISSSTVARATVGHYIPFTFTITRKDIGDIDEVTFVVETKLNWMINGQSRSTIRLAPGASHSVTLHLLPITTGWIFLPHINLIGIDSDNVFSHPPFHKIQIIPDNKFDCRCLLKESDLSALAVE